MLGVGVLGAIAAVMNVLRRNARRCPTKALFLLWARNLCAQTALLRRKQERDNSASRNTFPSRIPPPLSPAENDPALGAFETEVPHMFTPVRPVSAMRPAFRPGL